MGEAETQSTALNLMEALLARLGLSVYVPSSSGLGMQRR